MENLIRTDILQKVVNEGRIEWLKHSLERMMERGISRNEVKQVLVNGEIIEEYLYDKPIPVHCFLDGHTISHFMWLLPLIRIIGFAMS